MSKEENKAVIRRLIEEVYNGDDLDLLDELVAPDVVNHTAVAEHRRGIEGFGHVVGWSRSAMDAHYEIESMIAEGDMVACRITMSGVHRGEVAGLPPTGKRFSVEHVHWHRLASGKLAEPKERAWSAPSNARRGSPGDPAPANVRRRRANRSPPAGWR